MHKLCEPDTGRKIVGAILTLVSLVNLVVNYIWLRIGDIHKPQMHFVMRGGWDGFWFTTILCSIVGIAGIYLLVTSEPKTALKNKTALTDEEKSALKKRYSGSLAAFILFWVVFIPTVISFNYVVLSAILLVFFSYIIFIFSTTRCPNCGYRLVYCNQLLHMPKNCPKCGIALK